METLLVIDTSYLIYRSYFAYPHLSYNGEHTGAFYGFVKAIMEMSKELSPTAVIFATDTPEKTWRHEGYSGYKATRSPADAAMIAQIPLILEWSKSITPNVFANPGFEADDIIATVSKQYLLNETLTKAGKEANLVNQAQEDGLYSLQNANHLVSGDKQVLVFSSDRDLYQMFVTDGIKFVRAKTKGGDYELFGYDDFCKQYGLEASQWVDAKALVGDNSDNLPGLPGVGPKTASAILNEIGYLYYVYKVLGLDPAPFLYSSIPGDWEKKAQEFVENPKKQKYVTLLKDNYDQVVQMYKLSTLSDVGSLNVATTPPDFGAGLGMLEKYGFKSLIQSTKELMARSSQPESLF